ncbi:MAG: tetratricopeptide repeat protein [bacterium]
MIENKVRILFISILITLKPFTSFSSDEMSKYSDDLMYGLYGARAGGLGGAFTGSYGSTDSLLFNPSSSSILTQTILNVGYCRLLNFDTNVMNGSGIISLYPYGSIGFLYHRLWTGDIEIRDYNGSLIDTVGIAYNLAHFEYSYIIKRKFSVGGGFNYIYRTFGEETNNIIIPNVGLLIFPVSSPIDEGHFIPAFGASFSFSKPYRIRSGLSISYQTLSMKAFSFLSDFHISEDKKKLFIGAEIKPHHSTSFRLGLMDKMPTVGIGLTGSNYSLSFATAFREGYQSHFLDWTVNIGQDRLSKERMLEYYRRLIGEGRYHMSIGRYDLAIRCFQNAVDTYPEGELAREMLKKATVEMVIKEGRDYYENGEFDKALETFKNILSIDPENNRAKGYIILTENTMKKREEEERKKREASELVMKGEEQLNKGNYTLALKYYKDALNITPTDTNLIKRIDYINSILSKPIKPPEITTEMLKHYEDGIKMFNSGDVLGAIKELEIVYSNFGNYKDTTKTLIQSYYYYGLKRYGTGDLEGAISYWKKILSIDPINQDAMGLIERAEKELSGLK